MYFIVSHFYHEPLAREIGQSLPVYLMVNKLYLYLYLSNCVPTPPLKPKINPDLSAVNCY